MTNRTLGPLNLVLMLTVITFWGSSFVVVKIVLEKGLTPVAVATYRFLIAGGVFIAILLLRKSRQRNYRLLIEKKDVPAMLVLALTGVTFFFIFQYTGIELAGASIAAIFVTLLSPILISIFSVRALNEHLTKKQISGIGIAAIGTLVVISEGTLILEGSGKFLLGSLILLLTPILWAIYNIIGKKTLEKYDSFLVVAYVSVLGGLGLIPFSLAENSFDRILALNPWEWLTVLFLAFACSLFGYFIWFYVVKQVGAAVTSSFLFLEPLVTVILAAVFAGEKLGLLTVVGGLLIFVGVRLIVTRQAQ